MTKIQKQSIRIIPLSDWNISPWDKQMYKKHELDFQKILVEYTEIKKRYGNNTKLARWKWLESKGAMSFTKNQFGIYEPNIIEDKYQTLSNMFEKFGDWLSFKEKMENTPEQLQDKINTVCGDIKKIINTKHFGIPNEIMDQIARDIKYETEKVDDVIQSALDNF